jgi:predicted acyltransferase (DUF342 family)
MLKPILSRDSLHESKDLFELKAGHYPDNVIPIDDMEVFRTVILREHSRVDGIIFGGKIELFPFSQAISVFGSTVRIHDNCFIGGNVQCSEKVQIGKKVEICGDVIGGVISIDDSSTISGNVISRDDITIGNNVVIQGYVVSHNGSIAIGDGSTVYDIIAKKDIIMGELVSIADPVILNSEGVLQFSKINIAGKKITHGKIEPIQEDHAINLYQMASKILGGNITIPKAGTKDDTK